MGIAAAPNAQIWSLAMFVVAVVAVALIMLGLSWVLGGRAHGRAKDEAFESGIVSVGSGRLRMSAKFYLVAMFFVIFDLEAVFLYAWAVTIREDGWAGFAEVTLFVAILLAGLVYLWRLGALDWAPASRRRRMESNARRLHNDAQAEN